MISRIRFIGGMMIATQIRKWLMNPTDALHFIGLQCSPKQYEIEWFSGLLLSLERKGSMFHV